MDPRKPKVDPQTNTFGNRLQILRLRAGYATPSALADRLEIAKQTVYNWEDRVDPLPSSKLRELAAVLGIESRLFTDDSLWTEGQPKLDLVVRDEAPPPYGAPSTRADCERYLAGILDLAEASKDPDAVPYIMRTLKHALPETDFAKAPGATEKLMGRVHEIEREGGQAGDSRKASS